MSKTKRRVPQQDRGERRVAEVLDAAAAVIAETGYEAATMTAVAERAGASIGALYQYFPNKEAIATALRQRYGLELREKWIPLTEQATKLSVKQLVDRIFDVMVEMMETRPAYLALQSAPRRKPKDMAGRARLRENFASLFQAKQPALSADEAYRIANVTVQIVKGMSTQCSEAIPGERVEIVREFKLVLCSYLSARLKAN